MSPWDIFCMKKILLALSLLLLLSGCSSIADLTADGGLPDHFWGYTTWKFNRGSGLSYDGERTARVEMEFIQNPDSPGSYDIQGTIHYNEASMSCSWAPGGAFCPVYDCSIGSTKDGSLIGDATEVDGILTVNLGYLSKEDRPEEMLTLACPDGSIATVTQPWSILAQTLQAEGGMVQQPWTLDVTGITFIDDIPTDATESSSAKTATRQFDSSVMYSGDTGSGLFALYRNQPK